MHRILFICHGNICRSPMAEYLLRHMVKVLGCAESFVIDSAATSTEEIGNPVHPGTRSKLQQQGVYCGTHCARQICPADYEAYDLLIGMDAANLRNMQRIFGKDPKTKLCRLLDFTARPGDIADPWYTGDFEETYEDILAGCRGLLRALGITKE